MFVCFTFRLGVFASTAPVVLAVWTAVYLTGYSDYLTHFHEPFSSSYGCHTGLTFFFSLVQSLTKTLTLNILQSQFTEKGFKKADNSSKNDCYCCFYLH